MSLENVGKTSQTQSTSSTTRTEASATLMKRGKPSDTIRGLDLAVSPKPKSQTVTISKGTEHIGRFDTNISMGQMDRSRLSGYTTFSPIASLKKHTPSTPEDLKVMNIALNKVINTVVEMPTKTVTREKEMAAVFNEKLGGVTKGLRALSATNPAAREIYTALTGSSGKLLSSDDITGLLKSASPAENKKGMAALHALNKLCSNPSLTAAAIRKSPDFTSNISGNTLNPIQIQTLFIKEARANIADMLFQGPIQKDLNKITVPDLVLPENITDFTANVGFNRLMSPNNMLGASLSSDVDFKLVLDDVSLKKELLTLNPSIKEGIDAQKADITSQIKEEHPDFDDAKVIEAVDKKLGELLDKALNDEVKKVSTALKQSLEGAKTSMATDFSLTLEVADFTVKTISGIKEQIANPKTSEIEQNFLATVLHNHSHMSGNEKVMGKFVDIIKDSLQFNKVATRNFDQYLGDSDKGSIKAIKNLPQMESLVNISADLITSNPELLNAAIDKLDLRNNPNAGQVRKMLTDNPGLLKQTLGVPAIKDALMASPNITTGLDLVDMFKGAANDKKLELSFKLVSSFTKEIDGEVNRSFIGKPGVKATDNWMYSVKYAGCRLNDFFDSTPKSVYVLSSNNVASAEKKYESVQSIAEPINSFAIQLQNRTYELAKAKDPSISHDDIDNLYDRVTANEFSEMLKSTDILPKLQSMVDKLVVDLSSVDTEAMKIMNSENLQMLKEVQTAIKGDLTSLTPDQLKELGHKLFNTISAITDNASTALQPAKPAVRTTHSLSI